MVDTILASVSLEDVLKLSIVVGVPSSGGNHKAVATSAIKRRLAESKLGKALPPGPPLFHIIQSPGKQAKWLLGQAHISK